MYRVILIVATFAFSGAFSIIQHVEASNEVILHEEEKQIHASEHLVLSAIELPSPTPEVIITPQQIVSTPKPIAAKKVPIVGNTTQKKIQTAAASLPITSTSLNFIWPVFNNKGTISRGILPGHTGIDIADKSGPFVVAMMSGTVLSTGWENGGGGCVVRVRFDNGYAGLYAHTKCNYQVAPGQRVSQGQPLANMGSTGNSTGTHLHIELFSPQGKLLNGLAYFSR